MRGPRSTSFFVFGLLVAQLSSSASATVLYVSPDGIDQYFDGSWNRCMSRYAPCATITKALSRASNGDELHLQSGNYAESTIKINRAISGIRIIGGYGTRFWSREIDPSLTLISGDRSHRIAQIDAIGVSVEVSFENLWLTYGSADRGGAIWVRSGSGGSAALNFDGVRFSDNRARYDGGAVYGVSSPGWGNALSITLTGCEFSQNKAWGTTGATLGGYGYGGALSVRTYSMSPGSPGTQLLLSDNDFLGNGATRSGSAVYLLSQNSGASLQATFKKNFIRIDDPVDFSLGAIEVHANAGDAALSFENNRIVENQQRGVLLNAWADGSITATHTNDTISGNSGQGIFAQSFGGHVDVDLMNTIVWGNTWYGDIYLSGNVVLSAEYSDIGRVMNYASYLPAASTFDSDPFFGGVGRTFNLSPTSPAIDRGICTKISCIPRPFPLPPICSVQQVAPSDDFEGDPRPFGATCDIGADEYVPEPSRMLLGLTALSALALLGARRHRLESR